MKQVLPFAVVLISLSLLFVACSNSDSTSKPPIKTDSASVALGKNIFDQKCSGCHSFRQDGIGPNLAGVADTTPVEWLTQFIKNPTALADAGDPRAHGLLKKFKTVMPSFATLTSEDLNDLLAYLQTQKARVEKTAKPDPGFIKNPIPAPIASSGMVVNLQLFAQIPPSSNEQPHTRIVKLDMTPDGNSMFVLDQRGFLYKLMNDKPAVYLDMAKWKADFINQPGLATGFGSFAFHPQFAKNGLFYTTHTEKANIKKADFAYADSIPVAMQWVLTEWKTADPNAATFGGTSRELLRINMVSGIHGVQEITFNPYAKKGDEDYGLLYMGVGDGGAVENGYPFLTHHPDHVWGTILRIDPRGHNSANRQYGIPTQNPFYKASDSTTLREIYAYGFRNPNRITWMRSGQMLATNIGQANIESLNIILRGHDYGWPIREGSFALHPSSDINFVYPLPRDDSAFHITYPVVQYDHDEGKAVSGGFEYTGQAVPPFAGKYFFGDVPTGRLFYVNTRDLKVGNRATIEEWEVGFEGKRIKLHDLCGNDRVDVHFGRDSKGELYLLTKPDGKIYKLISVAKNAVK